LEWYARIDPPPSAERLREVCTLADLPQLCADVYELTSVDGPGRGEISCVWGVFEASVEPIRNGVRYALTSCPNALQWTVTTRHDETTLHCSINHAAPDPDFARSIADFVANFRDGLQARLAAGAEVSP
jgi:hypothetical protein